MSEKIDVQLEFEKFSWSIKVKRENGKIILKLPAMVKSKLNMDNLQEGKEIQISLSSLLSGAGSFLKKFE